MLREHSHSKLTYIYNMKKWKWFCHQLSILRRSHAIYFIFLYWRFTVRCFDDWILSFFLAVAHWYANRELNRPLLWNSLRTIITNDYFERISGRRRQSIFRTHTTNDISNDYERTFRMHIKTSPYGTIRTKFQHIRISRLWVTNQDRNDQAAVDLLISFISERITWAR